MSINPWLVLDYNEYIFNPRKSEIIVPHLKVVDRLERVDAGHKAVLEAEQSGLEVLTSVPRILTDQEEVRLQKAASNNQSEKSIQVT